MNEYEKKNTRVVSARDGGIWYVIISSIIIVSMSIVVKQ